MVPSVSYHSALLHVTSSLYLSLVSVEYFVEAELMENVEDIGHC